MSKNSHAEKLTRQSTALVAEHNTRNITAATIELFSDANRLRKIAEDRSRIAPELAQGWQMEQLEVTKFNLDALWKSKNIKAATTDTLGMTNHEVADIIITDGKKQLKAFQVKSGNKPANTAKMLAEKKYSSVDLVGPADQHEKVKRLYQDRQATGTLKADDYASAERRLHKGIEVEGVSSGGTDYAEALNATDALNADKIASEFERKGVMAEMHTSGHQAGKIGATLAGSFSAVDGIFRWQRGEAGAGEVFAQVAVDAAKGYAVSYATTAISKGINHVVRGGLQQIGGAEFGKAAGSALTKSNAHVALAAGIVEAGKSLVDYLNGDIDEEKLLSNISHTAMTGASAFYYGALGQAVIPIPIVGALVGSTVGYFVGNMLHQSGLVSLGETVGVRIAKERRERIQAMCLTAIPLMQEHRLELERLINQHFAERYAILSSAFDDLDKSLLTWDADKFSSGLQRVNEAFGETLQFKTMEEFCQFMEDDDSVFIL